MSTRGGDAGLRVPGFDRSYLPPAELEMVVVSDTHHILNPDMYSHEGDSVTPDLVRDWSARADWALALAGALDTTLVFHVGDLTQEYPGHPSYEDGQRSARARLEAAGLPTFYVAGNMDVGDKPDLTSPAGWVQPAYLEAHEAHFGRSYYGLSRNGVHFTVVNSQILNSKLAVAGEQRIWLERDLAEHSSERIIVLIHIPPFLVDEDEPGLGSYDVIDEPDRSWLLSLLRRYEVEALFAGHIHFRIFNRVGLTRLYTVPSTTLTRPGFGEVFPVCQPDRGWADLAKLGFFLVRVMRDGIAVHPIRSNGHIGPQDGTGKKVITRLSRDLRRSPLGAYLRLPLATRSAGAIAYPNHIRHRIRDDYPLLGCLELGLQHVRFPSHDLEDEFQRGRLGALRDEGVHLTATVIRQNVDPPSDVRNITDVDCVELQLADRLLPSDDDLAMAATLRVSGITVALAPIIMERVGTVHLRSRIGYRPGELAKVDELLTGRDHRIDRAVCVLDPAQERPWATVRALAAARFRSIDALDLILRLGENYSENIALVAEGLLAAATVRMCRLVIDPLQDLDRTAALMGGLLDRLSNPRPAFHVARVMNTVLFDRHAPGAYAPVALDPTKDVTGMHGVECDGRETWLITDRTTGQAVDVLSNRLSSHLRVKIIDLVAGESWEGSSGEMGSLLSGISGTAVLISTESACEAH